MKRDWSNKPVQSWTTCSISCNRDWMTWWRCSLTFEGVRDYACSQCLAICKSSSNWILTASSWFLWTPTTSSWIFSAVGSVVGTANSGMLLHTSSTVYSNPWFWVTRLSCCSLSSSKFSFCSLKTWIVWPFLVRSSAVTPSCSWYNVSLGRAAKFNP